LQSKHCCFVTSRNFIGRSHASPSYYLRCRSKRPSPSSFDPLRLLVRPALGPIVATFLLGDLSLAYLRVRVRFRRSNDRPPLVIISISMLRTPLAPGAVQFVLLATTLVNCPRTLSVLRSLCGKDFGTVDTEGQSIDPGNIILSSSKALTCSFIRLSLHWHSIM
jgi:hypothetical protein